ncbi:MAG: glutamate--tRNA ligase [Alphaproteobacteria bacterium]|jgi:glutamyl-tRNA synthetase|nr:glutamate--tRNA ligase [Alphaproteobacteria bacterium]
MSVVVRFAPSPTGFLHIGGARTALFNWLYARHTGGKFYMRVEDTDRERSTPESVQTILDGMLWLGMDWDNKDTAQNNGKSYYSQYEMRARHVEVAEQMIAAGKAYYCYASPEELGAMREEQKAKGLPMRYDGRWRDRPASDAPAGVKPVIRLKAPLEGETVVDDLVKGTVTVQNSQLDDMVLVRGDGSPTYMLAVVVDDHDMGITHVIRGDDHFTNTFRQIQIYRAMGWDLPRFAHLPMILGPDGAKLSKRHGAPAVSDYRDRGYLPEAICNYLLRLCWAHGDDEIIPMKQAIEWFDFDGVGRSPARFDFAKLNHLNGHYIGQTPDDVLARLAQPFVEKVIGRVLSDTDLDLLTQALPDIKPRVQLLTEIAEAAQFYFQSLAPDEKALKILSAEAKGLLAQLASRMEVLASFSKEEVEGLFRSFAEEQGVKLGSVAQPLRAALTGRGVSPPIFAAAALLGKDETVKRVRNATR